MWIVLASVKFPIAHLHGILMWIITFGGCHKDGTIGGSISGQGRPSSYFSCGRL